MSLKVGEARAIARVLRAWVARDEGDGRDASLAQEVSDAEDALRAMGWTDAEIDELDRISSEAEASWKGEK